MTEIIQQKHRIRRSILRNLSLMSVEDRMLESALLCGQFRSILGAPKGRCLFGFSAMPSEPDLTEFYRAWCGQGGVLCLPRRTSCETGYEPAVVHDLDLGVKQGAFGISEPSLEAEKVPWSRLAFTLVPGVAFDNNGCRLGRGKGFYDRMLKLAGGKKLGVAFSFQQVEAVPMEPHDVRLDGVVWANGLTSVTEVDF